MLSDKTIIAMFLCISFVIAVNVSATEHLWQLTDFPGDELCPDWSPDGSTIAYNHNGDIWTIPARGGAPTQLTTSYYDEAQPDWSPDGTYIAFMRKMLGLYYQILKIPSAGGDVTILTESRSYSPSWSPDGSWVVYSMAELFGSFYINCIFKTISDGGPGERLTDFDEFDYWPTWSPNGSTVAFYSRRGGNYGIWSVPASGGELTQVTDFAGDERYPDWSWDNDRIAYAWCEFDQDPKDIYTIPSSGGSPKQITTDPADDTYPSWSPDGEMIVFSSDRDGDYDLWIIKEQYESIAPMSVGRIKALFR